MKDKTMVIVICPDCSGFGEDEDGVCEECLGFGEIEEEKPKCKWDTDNDGNCHLCINYFGQCHEKVYQKNT